MHKLDISRAWLRMPSVRLWSRVATGALVLLTLLRLRNHKSRPIPVQRDAFTCEPYDPITRPGNAHIFSRRFHLSPDLPEHVKHPRGVVMTASGNITRQAAGAFVTAYTFRQVLHSNIPIIIYHVGPSEAFLDPIRAALLSLPDVYLIDLTQALDAQYEATRLIDPSAQLPPRPKDLRGYAAKAYAVQASPFKEAILLDAGAVPFVSPEYLFILPSYREHGMAMFSDYVAIEESSWGEPLRTGLCLDYWNAHKTLGGRELDSSCLVLDRRRNEDALQVVVALNGPLQETTYRLFIGDKDTWALSMLYVGKKINVEGLEPGYILVAPDKDLSRARKITGHLQFVRDPQTEPYGLVPIHHNNQLVDYRAYPMLSDRTYLSVFSHLGDVLMPVTRVRDCRLFPVAGLMGLPEVMQKAFLAVARGLKEYGIDHCVCRDDWISCEEDLLRIRHQKLKYRVYDAIFGLPALLP